MMFPEGSIKVLAQESLGEIIIWLLVFFVNAIFLGITSKNKTARMVIGGILLVAEVCLMSYGQAFSEIFLAVLETAFTEIIICLFPGMDVDNTEIPFVFLMLFIPPRYFNSTDMVLAGSQVFLIILLVIFSFAIITGRIKKEPIILFYFSFVGCSFFTYLFKTIGASIYDVFRYTLSSNAVFLIAGELLTGSCLIVLAFFSIQWLNKVIEGIRRTGLKNRVINRYTIVFMMITVFVLIGAHIPFIITRTSTGVLQRMLYAFFFIIFALQVGFLIVLSYSADYQLSIRSLKALQQNNREYYNALNSNLKEMADIRHDMKNIFLSMNSFVERSDDEQMKEFFKEKIYPFSEKQLSMNTLFAKLMEIPDEILKSFLYMKAIEISNCSLDMRLKVSVDTDLNGFEVDIIDLCRILGILLDNAREEAELSDERYVYLGVASDTEMISFTIRNPISDKELLNGHIQERGVTSKEGHKGLGLSIVNEIVSMYPGCVLNTTANDGEFIQILNIEL